MKSDNPSISVCIPTCNRPEMLKKAITSVLAQSFEDYELIISDNASDVSTAEVVASFKDRRIIHIRKTKNIGLVGNFNSCLSEAKGRYITVFHDDDLMRPDNLLLKFRALEEDPKVGLAHSNFDIIDENDNYVQENAHFLGDQNMRERGVDFLRNCLLGPNPVNPPSAFIRKECYDRLGGFSEKVHFTTDWEYWMRISMHYDVIYLGAPLIAYRMYHDSGWTSSRYLTKLSGFVYSNFLGLQEEYSAKKIILSQSQRLYKDWIHLNSLVQKRTIQSLNLLVERMHLKYGKKHEAFKVILRIGRAFPELFFHTDTVKLVLKSLFGLRLIRLLKRDRVRA